MLRIKGFVPLEELVKHGFKYRSNNIQEWYEIKDNFKEVLVFSDRQICILPNLNYSNYLEVDIIFELTQAGLVEKI